MNVAHARGGNVLSEKTVELLFSSNILSKKDFRNPTELGNKISNCAIFTLPVGAAAQDAAIAAIATLATRHEVLRDAAIQGLESIRTFKPEMVEQHLARLREHNN